MKAKYIKILTERDSLYGLWSDLIKSNQHFRDMTRFDKFGSSNPREGYPMSNRSEEHDKVILSRKEWNDCNRLRDTVIFFLSD